MELFNPNSNIDFLGGRKVSIILSAVLVLVSIGLVATRGLNYALDFTGGVLVEAKYEQPVEVDQVRSALEAGGFHSAQVQSVGGAKEVSIRLQPQADHKDAEQVGAAVIAALKAQHEAVQRLAVFREDDFKAFLREIAAQQVADASVIVNDENLVGTGCSLGHGAPMDL